MGCTGSQESSEKLVKVLGTPAQGDKNKIHKKIRDAIFSMIEANLMLRLAFADFTTDEMDKIINSFVKIQFERNSKLCQEDAPMTAMFFIVSGEFIGFDVHGNQICALGENECANEVGFLMKAPVYGMTLLATRRCIVFKLNLVDFEKVQFSFPVIFRKHPLLTMMKDLEAEAIFRHCSVLRCNKGDVIVAGATKKAENFYCIINGTVLRALDEAVLTKYFGEDGLLLATEFEDRGLWKSKYTANEHNTDVLVITAEGFKLPEFKDVREHLADLRNSPVVKKGSTGPADPSEVGSGVGTDLRRSARLSRKRSVRLKSSDLGQSSTVGAIPANGSENDIFGMFITDPVHSDLKASTSHLSDSTNSDQQCGLSLITTDPLILATFLGLVPPGPDTTSSNMSISNESTDGPQLNWTDTFSSTLNQILAIPIPSGEGGIDGIADEKGEKRKQRRESDKLAKDKSTIIEKNIA